tara:strand:+ start:14806 stop:15360 length:555 start_codon:yes stop_codon:yes gene_type:complete
MNRKKVKKRSTSLSGAGAKKTLGTALKEMTEDVGEDLLDQSDIPLVIRLVENPNYSTSKIFSGAVDLVTHDCIHILLGRGVELKDEAFVIGYTMGSSKKMKRWRRNLFMFICKYFYPQGYKFGEEERFIFNMGVVAGEQCGVDLSECSFCHLVDDPLETIRKDLGIDARLLKSCYDVEKRCFKL